MPLRNRVDPYGAIQADAARGMFTGNRGAIHDPATRTLLFRRWTTKAWIICACEFKGRKRQVMGRNTASGRAGWTELFFLDDVTALAAGHRPCFHCRRSDARAFLAACGKPAGGGARQLDDRLHAERLAAGGPPIGLAPSALEGLPDGTMVSAGGQAFALRRGHALAWSFSGYGRPMRLAHMCGGDLLQITPATTVSALRAGFLPVWHASAGLA